jgi:hypothetical protein
MSGSTKRTSRLAPDVIDRIRYLHDFEFLSFKKISDQLEIPNRTVQDAYNGVSKHRGYSLYRALKEDAKSIKDPARKAATLEWLEINKQKLFDTPGIYFSERQIRDRTRHETVNCKDLREILTTSELIKN